LKIPCTHIDLLSDQVRAVLSTIDASGQPHSTFTKCYYEHEHVMLLVSKDGSQYQNLNQTPKVSITVLDPEDDTRWLSVMGEVVAINEKANRTICKIKPRKAIAFHS